jgi:hypothetical protein
VRNLRSRLTVAFAKCHIEVSEFKTEFVCKLGFFLYRVGQFKTRVKSLKGSKSLQNL